MKPNNNKDKDKKREWKRVSVCIGGILLLIAVFAVLLPEGIPSGDEVPMCDLCLPPGDSAQEIAERLTAEGYVLYTLGGCHYCTEQLAEFGDAAGSLTVYDCAIAAQAYRFENVSEAEAAYDWICENGSLIHATNLTYANLTVRYEGYGILGQSNRNETCAALNISGYPTWIAPNGSEIIGFKSLDVIRGWVG